MVCTCLVQLPHTCPSRGQLFDDRMLLYDYINQTVELELPKLQRQAYSAGSDESGNTTLPHVAATALCSARERTLCCRHQLIAWRRAGRGAHLGTNSLISSVTQGHSS